MNIDKYKSIGAHLLDLYVNGNNIIYFDSFKVEDVQKIIKNS